jgi:hypothetical protein
MKPVLLVLALATLWQPDRPVDFSGRWTLDRARSQSADNATGPAVLVMSQSETELRIESTRNGRQDSIILRLDGSRADHGGDRTSLTRWEGSSLVSDVSGYVNGRAVTLREIRSIDKAGELTIVATVAVQHGYDGSSVNKLDRAGSNATTFTDVYVKQR